MFTLIRKSMLFAIAFSVGTSAVFAVEKKPRFFASFDYFGEGNIDENLGDIQQSFIGDVLSGGGLPSPSKETTSGTGGRIGALFPMQHKFFLGGSIGYLNGADVTSKVDNLLPAQSGSLEWKAENEFVRVLLEFANFFPITQRIDFRLGGGFGLAKGKTSQSETGRGFYSGFSAIETADSTGLTWEISPGFNFDLGRMDFELGLRYAMFPKIKETDTTYPIKFSSLGFFAGLAF